MQQTRAQVGRTLIHTLFVSTWYSQPNLLWPDTFNWVLWALAVISLVAGAWLLVARRHELSGRIHALAALSIPTTIAAALVTLVVMIKATSEGDSRVAFVGLSAFALALVVGSSYLPPFRRSHVRVVAPFLWPAALLLGDVYVFWRFLLPLGGL